ncbi:trypsin-like serine peptidase [Hyalangium versicolor]|uniref:trypsin-like serine peptidase n=1 Tax=Hyalangium versicolor TaxID=2861190 RepID=UPI001CCE1FA8|nr:serine protease [Hyalangium versicolor]
MLDPERIQKRLERALAGRELADIFPRSKGIAGLDAGVSFIIEHAQSAVRKIRAQEQPLAEELAALELGIRLARPAIRVVNGRLGENPALKLTPQEHAAVEAMLPGIALIELRSQGIATGWQVSRRVLATNRHVSQYLLQHAALERGEASAGFDADGRPRRAPSIPIKKVLASHPTYDIAFLEMEGDGPLERGLPMARTPELHPGAEVVVIGHPTSATDATYFARAIFGQEPYVKRASPGEILSIKDMELQHDCSTLRGNSGSPVIDCRTGQIVAIHTSAAPSHWNAGVSTSAIHADNTLQELVMAWT